MRQPKQVHQDVVRMLKFSLHAVFFKLNLKIETVFLFDDVFLFQVPLSLKWEHCRD